jgi:hypothetical protein
MTTGFRPLIHDRMKGKTVHAVMTKGNELIIELTNGEDIVIVWNTDGPVLLRQDVKITLPDAGGFGFAGGL